MKNFIKSKLCILLIIISVLLLTFIIVQANLIEEVKMYSVDGREIEVKMDDVEAYEKVGWYIEPVQILYAVDKTQVFKKSEVSAQLTVGWYTEPVVEMYALDGRTRVILKSEVEEYKKVGWYTEPVVNMYALDGRTRVTLQSEVEAYKAVGWYTEPVINMYASDGRTRVTKKSEIEAYKAVGWYTEPVVVMYASDGRTRVTLQSEVEEYKKVGWYLSKKEAQKNSINKNELELLARTIHAEAADNNYIDKCYVGMVVMNRKKSGKWGNSIQSVISAPGQYSSYRNRKFNSPIPNDCYEIAKQIMLGETFGVPYNVIFQSGSPQGTGIWKVVNNTAGYYNHYYCYGNI